MIARTSDDCLRFAAYPVVHRSQHDCKADVTKSSIKNLKKKKNTNRSVIVFSLNLSINHQNTSLKLRNGGQAVCSEMSATEHRFPEMSEQTHGGPVLVWPVWATVVLRQSKQISR